MFTFSYKFTVGQKSELFSKVSQDMQIIGDMWVHVLFRDVK